MMRLALVLALLGCGTPTEVGKPEAIEPTVVAPPPPPVRPASRPDPVAFEWATNHYAITNAIDPRSACDVVAALLCTDGECTCEGPVLERHAALAIEHAAIFTTDNHDMGHAYVLVTGAGGVYDHVAILSQGISDVGSSHQTTFDAIELGTEAGTTFVTIESHNEERASTCDDSHRFSQTTRDVQFCDLSSEDDDHLFCTGPLPREYEMDTHDTSESPVDRHVSFALAIRREGSDLVIRRRRGVLVPEWDGFLLGRHPIADFQRP